MMHTETHWHNIEYPEAMQCRSGENISIFMLYEMCQYGVLNMVNILQLVFNGVNLTAFLHNSGDSA